MAIALQQFALRWLQQRLTHLMNVADQFIEMFEVILYRQLFFKTINTLFKYTVNLTQSATNAKLVSFACLVYFNNLLLVSDLLQPSRQLFT